MYNYLLEQLDAAHGAFINRLLFIPSEVMIEGQSNAMWEFAYQGVPDICKTLNWKETESVRQSLKEYIETSSLARCLSIQKKNGFLAEVYIPAHMRLRPESKTTMASQGHCHIEWLYADSIGELVNKLQKRAEALYQEAINKIKFEKKDKPFGDQ